MIAPRLTDYEALCGLLAFAAGIGLIAWWRHNQPRRPKPQPREDLRPVFEVLDAEPIEESGRVDANGRLHGKGGKFVKK